MKQIVVMSGWLLLAVVMLFLGFFALYVDGVAGVGIAITLWVISGVLVAHLVVPIFASLLIGKQEDML